MVAVILMLVLANRGVRFYLFYGLITVFSMDDACENGFGI